MGIESELFLSLLHTIISLISTKIYKMKFRINAILLFISLAFYNCSIQKTSVDYKREIWTPKQANNWYANQGWLIGANFIPSNAINQLEMWQAETFDTATIAR